MTTLVRHSSQLYFSEQTLPDFDVRGVVLLSRTHALVWDTLSHPDDMTGVAELCRGKTVTVVYSHADWDHIWGTIALDYQDVVAHESCARRFADPGDVAATLREKQAQDAYYSDVILVPPTRTFQDTLVLELDDLTVELHHLPGHTHDCTVAFVPALGVLLAGDTVETPLPVVPENPPLNLWLAKLAVWQQDPRVKSVAPSHGPVGGRELIEHTASYLEALQKGEDTALPKTLSAFYRQTHEANRKHANREHARRYI